MSNPGTFHELYCQNGMNPECLARIAPKPSPCVVTTSENIQQRLRDPFANKSNFNKRDFTRGRCLNIPQMVEDYVFKIKTKLEIFLTIMIDI